MQADLDLMQPRFSHDPRQTREKPIMTGSPIVRAHGVCNQDTEQRAQIKEHLTVLLTEMRQAIAWHVPISTPRVRITRLGASSPMLVSPCLS